MATPGSYKCLTPGPPFKGGAVGSDGEIVAYVRRDGRILSMPGWRSGEVRSIVVVRVDGIVEILGGHSRPGSTLEDLLGEPDPPKREPDLPKRESDSPGSPCFAAPPGLELPPVPPFPVGFALSTSGLEAAGSGGKRRKRRVLAGLQAPPGVPRAVFAHHWEHVPPRGQEAAVAGDVMYILHHCAETGCSRCMFSLLKANLPDCEDLIHRTCSSGYDCYAWAGWGVRQALKVADYSRVDACSAVERHLQSMMYSSVSAVVREWADADSEEAPLLLALEDS